MKTGDKIFWIYWCLFLLIAILSKVNTLVVLLGFVFGAIIAWLSFKLDTKYIE